MAEDRVEMTTVMVDVETRDLLKELAARNERSMAAQLRFMVKQALAATNAARLYLEEDAPGTVETGVA